MLKKKILITGGAGFIGSALADKLSCGSNRVFVGDSAQRLEKYVIPVPGVEYLSFNWLDSNTFPGFNEFDVVIHLAWSSNPMTSMENIGEDAENNILGTINFLEHLPVNQLDKFIFMSSGGTVYGNNELQIVSEDCLPNPISAYGVSKLACEKYIDIYGKIKCYSPCILRLGNPYGAYQLQGTPVGVIASFVRQALENQVIKIRGTGDAVRDYIHIDDVSEYVARIVSTDKITGTYNIASGMGVSLTKILHLIEDISGETLSIEYTKAPESDVRAVVLDCEKVSNAVNFQPQIRLEIGIEHLIEVYRSTAFFTDTNTVLSGTGS